MEPTTVSTNTPTLTPEDPTLLSAIGDEGTGVFQLATELRLTPSEVSQAIERLSGAGFIEARDDWVNLLPDGRSFLRSIGSLGKVARIGAARPPEVTLTGSADAELDEVLAALRSSENSLSRNSNASG